jgi:hypothetical protein
MGDVINLRAARKAKARLAGQALAEANRARHGRTKSEVATERADAERSRRLLDQAKRETE